MNMNKKMVVKSSLVAVVLAGVCGAAFAGQDATPMPATGQVKFVGAVVDAPCNIDAGSVDQTIQMGVLSQQSLYAKNTKVQPFDIKLTQCSTATVKSAVVSFTGIVDANVKTDLSSGLGNVGIELSNDNGVIGLGQATTPQILNDGVNNLRFYAKAVYTGSDAKTVPAEIGDFAAVSQFSVTYQ
ncbi:fimbrial protein [Aeromonas hydrophila]|uniref:fimbrial protein n=1 Tax=Aeromonas hydrophila TaxID=644 RepID=UPI002ED60B89|nr:fimbrial protein [Aeromonas hydrophila]